MLFWIKGDPLEIQILYLLLITFKKLYIRFPFRAQLQLYDLSFGTPGDHRVRSSGHFWGHSLHGKVSVYVGIKQSILRALFSITHPSITSCNLNFCIKSAGNCKLQFSHCSMQCCNTNWNSETRNNYMVHPGEGVYVSCTGIEYRKKKKL